ncbi:MAG: LemA family protein [Candidatus Omnitrophota bacterium]|jgi:LemA protein
MYIFIAGIVIAVILGMIFNRFIKYRTLMREAWSGIDVQLKRRHDLIPNILESVKGYMGYEQKLFESVAVIRSKIGNVQGIKDKSQVENELSGALKSVFALAEAYPDLKANKSFLGLQQSLIEVEDQIQMARRYFNGTVRNNNILVESFPSNLVAGMFNFKIAEFFEIEFATERKAPEVKFNQPS